MDVVITYVRMTDEFKKNYNSSVKIPLDPIRFRTYNVLEEQVGLIRKYMNYVRNIYVVVSNHEQVDGLNLDGCKIVTHDEIMPKCYLPCFNSCAIEMFLWRIPGLSEEFVYFNDDCFVTNDVPYEYWFKGGKPCLCPTIVPSAQHSNTVYKNNLINSSAAIARLVNSSAHQNGYIVQEHCARPFLRSSCKYVYKKLCKEIHERCTRIRNHRNFNATLFNNFDFMTGRYVYKDKKYGKEKFYYTSLGDNRYGDAILNKKCQLICVNDSYGSNFFYETKLLKKYLQCNLYDIKFTSSDLPVVQKIVKNNSEKLKLDEDLYVSFTSWPKRIGYCARTVRMMTNQTMVPTKIILNLSLEEFPEREKSLPEDLVDELRENDLFEICWVEKNTYVWKKIIPTMMKYPDALVLSVDDDIDYPSNYIEEMFREYVNWGRNCPIVAYKYNGKHGNFMHSGPFTLTKGSFYGNYLTEIYNELILPSIDSVKWQSDVVYSYIILLAGRRYRPCYYIDGNRLYKESEINKNDRYSDYGSAEYKESLARNKKTLEDFIKQKYGKSLDDGSIFASDIIVNVTTYPGRDKYLYTALSHFKYQTKKPDKIVLWLSDSEYSKDELPRTIKNCIKDKLVDEVRYCNNTYAHKRWNIQKTNPGAYNINIDDDIYYEPTYVEELYDAAIHHQDCVIVYTGAGMRFIGDHRQYSKPDNKPSYMNTLFGGMCCVPPYIFPQESTKFDSERDKYVPMCDQSWINAWLLKKHIKIVTIHDRKTHPWLVIKGSQEHSIWKEHNLIKSANGVTKLDTNFANALCICGGMENALNVWPRFDIYSVADDKVVVQYVNLATDSSSFE